MAYGIVRTDNMSGTTMGKDLVSVKYQVGNTDTAIENGAVVLIGDYIDGEVRKATAPAANSPLNSVALIASEEVDKAKTYNTLGEFKNEAGAIARGYRFRSGDTFAVTAAALDGTPAKDAVVELQAGTKMKVVTQATSGSTKIGTIVDVEGEWYVIEVA